MGVNSQDSHGRHGSAIPPSGRSREGDVSPESQDSTQDLLGSGNAPTFPPQFSSMSITNEWQNDTTIAIYTSGSQRLLPGEEDEKLTSILNHYLQWYEDCRERKEWIIRHWKGWGAAVVRKYGLKESTTTFGTMHNQVRSLEIEISAGK